MAGFFDSLKMGFGGASRILNSGLVFSTKTLLLLKDLALGGDSSETIAIRLREAFEELGATYIKLGQFIASAPSLFPEEFVTEMQKCLDSVRPLSFSVVEKIIQRELGGKLSDHFYSVEPVPIASASIAQVHGAVTKDGLDVVIKVQRPDIESTLSADLNLIYFTSVLFERFAPGLNKAGISDMVEQFQTSILEEIDFHKEADNIVEFELELLAMGETRARVPKVYREFSTKKILTMERFYGAPITDETSIRRYSSDPQKTLTEALEVWFSTLARNGFFHADVHAGNLMILRDGTVGFIDFGIVGRISPRVWEGLMIFLEGLSLNRTEKIAKGLIQMDSTAKGVDEKKLSKDLETVFSRMTEMVMKVQRGDLESLDDKKLNALLFEFREISSRNGLKIPKEFGLLIKQILYFDRYVRAMAPDIDLIRDREKFLR
ncbi:AarF/ABC1/UbiB kinase family protein [Leptospira gomenensis]|uniref:AarF/ABC1/UbiB kinase family protein n=1 Tax=Leptospira gomenensis TaxID=2484974 RepID=A0A5F1YFQ3_9LEPT|nr:AarF/UbiB family protein [Leptospira gomenensis]TGK37543.1 AarF/ABC1/UbiB kinase family protein [Leptospira gomenensis]TGK39451.1 AarF/ABC1/UbiB kinase family protein [Leptospira gomenensis]TGK43127.1 AarF/ABC1/UbiB kinase family protein [Leptospira gomenensis]TGK55044.1 AarF/ABC1/UbiB kinase family protein [Leptospira gomenensis]